MRRRFGSYCFPLSLLHHSSLKLVFRAQRKIDIKALHALDLQRDDYFTSGLGYYCRCSRQRLARQVVRRLVNNQSETSHWGREYKLIILQVLGWQMIVWTNALPFEGIGVSYSHE